jgi:hypothetical protein
MKESNKLLLFSLGLIILAFQLSCNKVAEKKPADISVLQEKAKVSINNWVRKHPEEFVKYKPIAFEAFTARYERTELTHYLSDKVEEELSKPVINQQKIDSLKTLLENNKGILMGYTILHKYHTKTIAGEVIKHQDLVFLDTTFHVATILDPDAYDMIMDLKLIFKPDSLPKK